MEIAIPAPELVGQFEQRLVADVTERIEEWSRCRQDLTKWEERHLLDSNPAQEKLAEHKEMLEMLIFYGQLFSLATSHPKFPDTELADEVHANLWVLREKFQMYHNPMSKEEADRILQEVFPEP
jgi:hypothetical protein